MPESICCDEGVRGENDGEEADDGEGGEQDAGGSRDCPLHQGAVVGRSRDESYWGKYSEKECQWKRHLLIFLFEEGDKVTQDDDDDEGYWADHIVAKEARAHC